MWPAEDGPELGEFYPRFTGTAESVREFIAPLEPPGEGTAVRRPLGTLSATRHCQRNPAGEEREAHRLDRPWCAAAPTGGERGTSGRNWRCAARLVVHLGVKAVLFAHEVRAEGRTRLATAGPMDEVVNPTDSDCGAGTVSIFTATMPPSE